MRKKNDRKGWVMVKVDLEKAYDRIEWVFLEKVLRAVGLEDFLIKLIMF